MQPSMPRLKDRFLVVLSPTINRRSQVVVAPVAVTNKVGKAVRLLNIVVIFVDQPVSQLSLNLPQNVTQVYVVGGEPKSVITVNISGSNRITAVINHAGIGKFVVQR